MVVGGRHASVVATYLLVSRGNGLTVGHPRRRTNISVQLVNLGGFVVLSMEIFKKRRIGSLEILLKMFEYEDF